MRISQDLIDEIVAHAREDAPNECCGLVGGRDGSAVGVYRAKNLFESPMRFEIDDLQRRLSAIEDAGQELVAMYHSHPRSEAYPSETDRNLAWGWPGVVWVICSLAGSEPVVRAFEIADKEVDEIELELVS